jgi:excisionase family DNA binding protein
VSDRIDLAALIADPVCAIEVPAEERQTVLDALAVHEGRCRLVRELLTANLTGLVAATLAANDPLTTAGTEAGALTQEEAAERYRIPLRKVRFLTRTQRVASYRQGRNRMVRPCDLDQYLARCREQGVKVGTILDFGTIHNG